MKRLIAVIVWTAACGGAQAHPKPAGKLFLELHVQAQVVGDAAIRSVRMGDTLESGDKVELYVVPSEDAYVSVLQVGADDKLAPLYPAGHLKGGQTTRVPESGWFELDQNVGEETIVVIASRTPLSESDPEAAALVERARAGGTAESRHRCQPPVAAVRGLPGSEPGAGATPPARNAPAEEGLRMIGGVSVATLAGVPKTGLASAPEVAEPPIDADTARIARPATISPDGTPQDPTPPGPPSEPTAATSGQRLIAARGLNYVPSTDSGTVIESDARGVAITEFAFCHATR